MRLIDADKLPRHGRRGGIVYWRDIEALPSAEPEIIRCKDCRHNGSFDTDCPIDWNGKEYCSFAERRTDD